jgi:hypothetical protein
MASSMHIRSSLVNSGVNHKASNINSSSVASDHISKLVDMHHIASLEHAEVVTERVDPEGIWVNGISDTDVPAGALRIALPVENTEGPCHVLQLPFSLVKKIVENWDCGEFQAIGGNDAVCVLGLLVFRGVESLRDDRDGGLRLCQRHDGRFLTIPRTRLKKVVCCDCKSLNVSSLLTALDKVLTTLRKPNSLPHFRAFTRSFDPQASGKGIMIHKNRHGKL